MNSVNQCSVVNIDVNILSSDDVFHNDTVRQVTDLVRRLGEIHMHCSVVRLISLCVVPYIVTVHSIGVVVYQYISALT